MARGVAVGRLVDECRRGGETTRGVALQEVTASDRVKSYLVSAGAVRRGEDRTFSFGRRVVDDRFVLAELGDEEMAVLCYLPDADALLVDRGGRLLENDYVAALLGGYYDHHAGDFQLHAQPLAPEGAEDVRNALSDLGLIDDDREGSFAGPLSRMADALDARV